MEAARGAAALRTMSTHARPQSQLNSCRTWGTRGGLAGGPVASSGRAGGGCSADRSVAALAAHPAGSAGGVLWPPGQHSTSQYCSTSGVSCQGWAAVPDTVNLPGRRSCHTTLTWQRPRPDDHTWFCRRASTAADASTGVLD